MKPVLVLSQEKNLSSEEVSQFSTGRLCFIIVHVRNIAKVCAIYALHSFISHGSRKCYKELFNLHFATLERDVETKN